MLIVQGTADEAVPYDITAGPLLQELLAYGTQPVEFLTVDGANHDQTVVDTVGTVATWIAGRFT
jgi:hypothetical protein